jgi:hypothetical protein
MKHSIYYCLTTANATGPNVKCFACEVFREKSVEMLTKVVNDIVTKINRTHYERNEAELSMISKLNL